MNSKNINSKVSIMALMTSLSRIFGLIRTILFATMFGTSSMGDAFLFVFKIPNLFRRMFAEGAMTAGFIPIFSKLNKKNGDDQLFFSQIFSLILLSTTVLSLLLAIFSPFIIKIAYYFSANQQPAIQEQAILLLRYISPYIIFISLAAVLQGVLNSRDNFKTPAITPVFFNLAIIISGILFYYFYSDTNNENLKSYFLTAGIIVGGIIQLIYQLPALFKLKYNLKLSFSFKNNKVVIYFKRIIPVIFSSSIYQLNTIPVDIISLGLTTGALSSLFYSRRLMELPLGIIVISLTTVLLPKLSKIEIITDKKNAENILTHTINLMLITLVPIIAFTIVFNSEIVSLLFSFGIFGNTSIALTSACLTFHISSVIAIGFMRIFQTVFYANNNTKIPAIVSVVTLILNLLITISLLKWLNFQSEGIAFASLISITLSAALLFLLLHKKYRLNILKSIFITTAKTVVAVIIPIALFIMIKHYINLNIISDFFQLTGIFAEKENIIWKLTTGFLIIIIIYIPMIHLFKIDNFNIFNKVKYLLIRST